MSHTKKSLLFAMLLSVAVAAQYGSAPPPPPSFAPIYRPQAPPSGPFGGPAPMKQYYASPSYAALPQPLPQYALGAPIYRPAARPLPSYSAPFVPSSAPPQYYGSSNGLSSYAQQVAPMLYPPRQSATSYNNYAPVPSKNTNFALSTQQQVVPQTFAVLPTQLSSPSYESAPANLLAPPPLPQFSPPISPFAPVAVPPYQPQSMQYNNPQIYASAPEMQAQQIAVTSYSGPAAPAASLPSCVPSSNNVPLADNSPDMQSVPIYGVPPSSSSLSSVSSSEPLLPMESAPAAVQPRQPDSSSTDYLLPILYAAASPQIQATPPIFESIPVQQTYNSNSYQNQ